MRTYPLAFLAASLLAASATPLLASDGAFGHAVLPIRVSTESGPLQATAVVVRREDKSGLVSLDLLTSATLFETPRGDCEVRPVSVRLPDGRWVAVEPHDIRVPDGPVLDIAILRATAPAADVVPEPIDFAPPAIGSVFVVAGVDSHNDMTTVGQHVGVESTLVMVGDRDLSSLVGCVGAPAISPQGVVGIVRACDAGRAPMISLLASARAFIEQSLPRAVTTVTADSTPQFQVVDRELRLPLWPSPAGHVTVPVELGLGEALVDATASIAVPRELGLAQIRVLRIDDRDVRLAFTIGGGTPLGRPAVPPPYGQAVVTVHVRVAVVGTP